MNPVRSGWQRNFPEECGTLQEAGYHKVDCACMVVLSVLSISSRGPWTVDFQIVHVLGDYDR
jgi:hypothetical protein